MNRKERPTKPLLSICLTGKELRSSLHACHDALGRHDNDKQSYAIMPGVHTKDYHIVQPASTAATLLKHGRHDHNDQERQAKKALEAKRMAHPKNHAPIHENCSKNPTKLNKTSDRSRQQSSEAKKAGLSHFHTAGRADVRCRFHAMLLRRHIEQTGKMTIYVHATRHSFCDLWNRQQPRRLGNSHPSGTGGNEFFAPGIFT